MVVEEFVLDASQPEWKLVIQITSDDVYEYPISQSVVENREQLTNVIREKIADHGLSRVRVRIDYTNKEVIVTPKEVAG